MRNGFFLLPHWNIFHVSDFNFYFDKQDFHVQTFFQWQIRFCEQYLGLPFKHNVVIGIINQLQWATKTLTSRRLGIYAFQLQNPHRHQYFGLCFGQSCIRQTSFVISWFNRFIFSDKFCEKVLFFCYSRSLASVKSTWFKTFMSESIPQFKRLENQNKNLNWKKYICEEMKMFRKYQLVVWLSIWNFYSHFTKVTVLVAL